MSGSTNGQDVRRKLAALYPAPDLLPQKLDLVSRRILLLEIERQRYHDASFLDDRMIDAGTTGFWTGLDTLPAPPATRAAHWLFHIGHCGSTLLSRLLPAVCPLLPVREPPPLRTLAEGLRLLGEPTSRLRPREWDRLFRALASLYSRTYAPGGAALVKPSSDCINLVAAALEIHPDSRGILIYQSLDTYLATMLIGPEPRPDIEGHAVTRLMDLHAYLGDRESLRLYELTPVQRVVVSWLAGVAGLYTACCHGGSRLRTLDFDTFIEDPSAGISGLAEFLGMAADEGRIIAATRGPLMQTYAKAPEHRYSASDRAQQLAANRRRSAREIQEGLRWAESLVRRYEPLRPVVENFPMVRPGG
jgi:hypothetical protein